MKFITAYINILQLFAYLVCLDTLLHWNVTPRGQRLWRKCREQRWALHGASMVKTQPMAIKIIRELLFLGHLYHFQPLSSYIMFWGSDGKDQVALDHLINGEIEVQGRDMSAQRSHSKLGGTCPPHSLTKMYHVPPTTGPLPKLLLLPGQPFTPPPCKLLLFL